MTTKYGFHNSSSYFIVSNKKYKHKKDQWAKRGRTKLTRQFHMKVCCQKYDTAYFIQIQHTTRVNNELTISSWRQNCHFLASLLPFLVIGPKNRQQNVDFMTQSLSKTYCLLHPDTAYKGKQWTHHFMMTELSFL